MSTAREERLASLKVLETPPDLLESLRELAKLRAEDVARISEAQFVNVLLPTLTDKSGRADLRVWQDLAGTAMRPIDVVDPAGNVLFRVPSLLRRLETGRGSTDPKQSYSRIVAEAKLHLDRHPVLGATFLEQSLGRMAKGGSIDYETARQWNMILARYGKELLPIEMPATETTSQDTKKDVGNLFSDEEEAL